jgi:hypothetical protein
VVVFALFVYGMWCGVVHLRWGPLGTAGFIAAQALVLITVAVAVTLKHGHVWSRAGGSFAGLTALGLTGGHATIRRVTV